MNSLKSIVIYICAFFVFWGYAQGDNLPGNTWVFYQDMALSDAQLEASITFSSPEDEADYWKDQLSFEKRLKEKEYSAYKTYLFYKMKAYRMHQKECDIKANHSKGYNLQARFYQSHGSIGEASTLNASGDLKPVSLDTQWH